MTNPEYPHRGYRINALRPAEPAAILAPASGYSRPAANAAP
jgi:hypothetical protein